MSQLVRYSDLTKKGDSMRKSVFKKFVVIALLSMVVPATGFAADTIKIGKWTHV